MDEQVSKVNGHRQISILEKDLQVGIDDLFHPEGLRILEEERDLPLLKFDIVLEGRGCEIRVAFVS